MKRIFTPKLLLLLSFLFLASQMGYAQTYCTPSYKGLGFNNTGKTTSFWTHILEVHLGDLNSVVPAPTVNPSPSYQDLTNLSTDVVPGASYPVTVKLGNGANPQYMAVWIDWDQDQIFEKYERIIAKFDPSNVGDHEIHFTVKVPVNAAIGATRMRVGTRYAIDSSIFIPDPCTNNTFSLDFCQDFQDFTINVVKQDVQVFLSSNCYQPDQREVVAGTSDNMIMQIVVKTNAAGILNPMTAGTIKCKLSGTTNPFDVSNAKLYYSGKDPRFSVAKQIGSTVSFPSTYFSFNAAQQLQPGDNYFWLGYDVNSTALRGNILDAQVYSVDVAGPRLPDTISPAGNRKVGYCPSHGIQNNFVFLYYFTFNSIFNLSNIDSSGYGNYTRLSTTIYRNKTYKVISYTGNSYNNAYTRGWIDFNRDGDFNDSGELVFYDSLKMHPGYYLVDSPKIKVPANAVAGPTRMRVESFNWPDTTKYIKTDMDPCRDPVDIGEVEDYTVIIADNGQPVSYFKSNTVCLGSATKFTDSSYTFGSYKINSWHWDFGDGDTSILKSPSHTYANAGVYTVTLTVNSNLPGTPSVFKRVVSVNSPKAGFTNLGSVYKTPVVLADSTTGGLATSWYWNFGDPSSGTNDTSTQQNPIHVFDTVGTYQVKLIVTTAGGCIDSITKAVKIVQAIKPVANFSASTFTPHYGQPINLKDLSLNAPTSWSWNISPAKYTYYAGTGSSSTNPTVSLDSLADYKITLTVTNSAGSDTVSRFFVTQNYSKPSADFSATNTLVKAGQAVSFLDLSKNDPILWAWSLGNGDSSFVQNPIYKYKNTGTYDVGLTISNPAGTDTKTKTGFITVLNNYIMCQSDAAYSPLFAGYITDSGDSGNYFNFSNCGFLIKPDCSGPITLVFDSFDMAPHDYIKVYDGVDNTGTPLFSGLGLSGSSIPSSITTTSGAMFIQEVTDFTGRAPGFRAHWYAVPNAKPKADYSADTQGYVNSPMTFKNNTLVGVNNLYYWDYNNDGIIDDAGITDGYHSYSTPGTYKVKLIVINCKGKNSLIKTIKIVKQTAAPIADFTTSADTILIGDSLVLYDHSKNGPTSWSWNFNPDSALFNGYSSSYSQNPNLFFTAAGSYDITLTALNSFGKNSITKRAVYVKDLETMCSGTYSSFTSGKLYDAGGPNGNYHDSADCKMVISPCGQQLFMQLNYYDIYGGDYLYIYDGIDNTGTLLATYTGGSSSALPVITSKSGSLYIEMSTNKDGFTAPGFDADWWTTPYPKTSGAFTGPDTAYTGGSPAHFDAIDPNADHWNWDFNGDGVTDASTMHAKYNYSTKGTYKVRLISGRCSNNDTVYKTVVVVDPSAKPKVDFIADMVRAATTDTVQLTDHSSNGPNAWTWTISPNTDSFAYGSDSTSQDPRIIFNAVGKYTVKLKASNSLGTDTASKINYIEVFKYCIPTILNTGSDVGFSRVKIGAIDNTSAVSNQSYSDYTKTQATRLELSGTYALHLERLRKSSPEAHKVYIDFNANGSFSDPGEMVVSDYVNVNVTSWTDSFVVPKNAVQGPTRMRIGAGITVDSIFPCGTNYYGEYEDYRIIIGTDITPPVITIKGANPAKVEVGYPYIDSGATALDAIDGNVTSKIKAVSTVDTSTVGTYTVTYTVSDSAGNKATAIRKVLVTGDKTPPSLTLVGANPEKMEVFTNYIELGATAYDNRDKNVTKYVSIDRSELDTFRLGTYHVYYTAVDLSGNFAPQQKRTVIVMDTARPDITLLGPDSITISIHTAFVDPGATVVDNYWPALKLNVTGKVDTSKVGMYFIHYSATDGSNNTATVRRVVTVEKGSGIAQQLPAGWVLNIFPVPAKDNFTVHLKLPESKQISLDLLNSLGQVISTKDGGLMQEHQWTFPTENLKSGLYFLRINTINGSYTSKVQVLK